VLDAGGTNLRVAKGIAKADGVDLSDLTRCPMPGSLSPVDKQGLLNQLADMVEPLVEEGSNCGFCFSYEATIQENGDALVGGMGKGVVVTGIENTMLAKELNEILLQRGKPAMNTMVLNDTTATLMGALAQENESDYDGFIGFILGTGTNCAYIEDAKKVEKYPNFKGERMIINAEAGAFKGFIHGSADVRLVHEVSSKRSFNYEKMTAGAFFGPLAGHLFDIAVEEGILKTAEPHSHLELTTKELNEFMQNPYKKGKISDLLPDDHERDVAAKVFDMLLRRSGKCVALVLSSVMEQGDMGKTPERPACIAAEGSTYWKFPAYRRWIEHYLKEFAKEMGRSYVIKECNDTNLLGAALAAVSI